MSEQLVITVIGTLSGAVGTLAIALAWLGKKMINVIEENSKVMTQLLEVIKDQSKDHNRQAVNQDKILATCVECVNLLKYTKK